MAAQANNYVLGKGRVYFDDGNGERYLGNTPGFTINVTKQTLDHYSSEAGLGEKDDSVDTQVNRTGTITADNINADNVALFFNGTVEEVVQTAATAQTETITVNQDRYYQLGATEDLPQGVRMITNFSAKVGSVTVTLAGNIEVDEALGRIYIVDGAPGIKDGDALICTYDVEASTREVVISSSNAIYGAMRFVADNPHGTNRDVYCPYVKIGPNGDYALKGDQWQQLQFSLEVLLKDSKTAAVYIDGRAA